MDIDAQRYNLLSTFRVLDLTGEQGHFCGKILADLGADVIKIENPGGDTSRNIGPFYERTLDFEKSLFWFAQNTNKRSITLNLETVDGRDIFKRLVKTTDCVIESFDPGYMNSLGLDFNELKKSTPALIMTSITPWGQTGPYSRYQCCDIVAMAMGGQMYLTGDADRPPVMISIDQAYMQGGIHAAIGTLIAHHFCQNTGEGQHVDVSIVESVCRLIHIEFCEWQMSKKLIGRSGRFVSRGKFPLLSIFPCKDGDITFRFVVGMFGRRLIPLVDWMKREGEAGELEEVKDWTMIDLRDISQEQIQKWEDKFAKFFLKHTKAELFEQALETGISIGRANTLSDLRTDQQLKARNFWVEIEHPKLGTNITYPNVPYRFNNVTCSPWKCAPSIGEHNNEIYQQELGLSKDELFVLKQTNVI